MHVLVLLAESAAAAVVVLVAALVVYLRQLRRSGVKADTGSDHAVPSVGLLHPNAGAGGGGERVLWVAIATLMDADQRSGIHRPYTLYTKRYPAPGDKTTDARDTAHLLTLVRQQFNISIDASRLQVVYLRLTWALDAQLYPRCTMLLQTVIGGSMVFWDCASKGATDVIVDTVGIPFTYWLFAMACGTKLAAYVHYPVISIDMVSRVRTRSAEYNNSARVAGSTLLTHAKLLYYKAFSYLYWLSGGLFASAVMSNSSWTNDHVQYMWRRKDTTIVYPPCGVKLCQPTQTQRSDVIVSVGQFRPEKDHALQIRAFAKALQVRAVPHQTVLHLVGGCRDGTDRQRVQELRSLADALHLGDQVRFEVSVPVERVQELLKIATIGLHTMRDEHFGIVVVEYMAAGCVALAHNSAGPRRDIVKNGVTGFLAENMDEYVAQMKRIFDLRSDRAAWTALTDRARHDALRFTDRSFARGFTACLAPVLALTLMPEEDDDGVKLCC